MTWNPVPRALRTDEGIPPQEGEGRGAREMVVVPSFAPPQAPISTSGVHPSVMAEVLGSLAGKSHEELTQLEGVWPPPPAAGCPSLTPPSEAIPDPDLGSLPTPPSHSSPSVPLVPPFRRWGRRCGAGAAGWTWSTGTPSSSTSASSPPPRATAPHGPP